VVFPNGSESGGAPFGLEDAFFVKDVDSWLADFWRVGEGDAGTRTVAVLDAPRRCGAEAPLAGERETWGGSLSGDFDDLLFLGVFKDGRERGGRHRDAAEFFETVCDVGFEVDGCAGEGEREHHAVLRVQIEFGNVERRTITFLVVSVDSLFAVEGALGEGGAGGRYSPGGVALVDLDLVHGKGEGRGGIIIE
jgi:hypothetical protein